MPELFEELGIIKLQNKVVCSKTGVIQADILFNGKVYAKKTFFSSSWSQEKVMNKIFEAYKNFKGNPILDNNYWIVESLTNEGIKIQMVFDEFGKMIIAYPRIR